MDNKSLWKIIKNYKFKSIFFSYFKNMMILVFIPLLIVNLILLCSTNLFFKFNILDEAKNKSDKYTILADSIMDDCFVIYNQYLNNEGVNSVLYSLPGNGMEAHTTMTAIKNLMQSHLYTTDVISDIGFFSNKTNYLYSVNDCNFLNNVHNKAWYDLYIKNNQQNYIAVDPHTNNIIVLYNLRTRINPPGFIFVYVNKNALKDNINQIKSNEEEFVIIRENATNSIVYCSKEGIDAQGYIENSLNSSQATIKNLKFFNDCLTLQKQSNDNKLTIYTVINNKSTAGFFHNLWWFIIIYMTINFILLTTLIFYISKKFYFSIAEIVANFELQTDTSNEENMNEILYINSNIINLISNNKKFEYELANKLNKLKKAQTIALQTQINPHFIFNTLNLINSIIIEHTNFDSEEVQLICKLSSLLRNSLNTVQYLVPFSNELDYAKTYLDIELANYSDIFKVEYDISPEVYQCYTIKMILQPLIENAINHGVIRLNDGVLGIISIKAYSEDDNFIISISNNGPGIEPQKLEEIKRNLSNDDLPENEHLGLYNVANRIKLIYEHKGNLSIESSPNGTTVTITQPLTTSLNDII